MDLTTALSVSSGALTMRRMGNRLILFIQKPGMTKAQIVGAALTKEDCRKIEDYLESPEGMSNTAWNRFEVTVVTSADLVGT